MPEEYEALEDSIAALKQSLLRKELAGILGDDWADEVLRKRDAVAQATTAYREKEKGR